MTTVHEPLPDSTTDAVVHASPDAPDPIAAELGAPVGALTSAPLRVGRRRLFSEPWRRVAATFGAVGGTSVLAACELTTPSSDPLLHLLRRTTYGPTPESRAHLESIGATAWLAEQTDPTSLDTSQVDAKIASLPALSMSAVDLDANYPVNGYQAAAAQLKLASVIRGVHSPAQLFERMVEFWSDHFNVPTAGREASLLKIVEDREVIRPRALGRFKDLLVGSAQSPAMLHYLDNAFSFAGKINENYSRELLELHTVGVGGGYDENDVVALARLLTGWTIHPTTFGFQFRSGQHDKGHVEIMGWSRPGGTAYLDHGVQFLHHLAGLPQTAEFVCTKIARRFVADSPPADLVAAMTAAWAANDTQIVPVLEAMIAHPSFDAAKDTKFNRPLDYLALALRAMRADITPTTNLGDLQSLGTLLAALGQTPFEWFAPNGFPDVEGAWLNAGGLLTRWNLIGDLVANASPVVQHDLGTISSPLVGLGAHEIYDGFGEALLGEPVSGPGRIVLDQATGWDADTTPDGLEFLFAIGPIVITLLASVGAQYR